MTNHKEYDVPYFTHSKWGICVCVNTIDNKKHVSVGKPICKPSNASQIHGKLVI